MTEDESKILRHRMRTEFLDNLRQRRTRQGEFETSFLHLGHPLLLGGQILEASDSGQGAEAIQAACESEARWCGLFRRQYAKLPRKAKMILRAMLENKRSLAIARQTGFSRNTVKRWKTFFKTHFAQCLTARNALF